jgi:hypothetical protein
LATCSAARNLLFRICSSVNRRYRGFTNRRRGPAAVRSHGHPMQRFNAVLNPEDQSVARRAGRIVLMVYSATAITLTAAVLAHITFAQPTAADAALEARSKVQAVWHHTEAPTRFARSGSRS